MLEKGIIIFFITAIFVNFFSLDPVLSFCFVTILSLIYFIKSNEKFLFVFYLSFSFLAIFLININEKKVSPLLTNKEKISFIGKAVSVDKTITGYKSIFEIKEGLTLPSGEQMYAEIHTSMFQKVKLYENYKIEGFTSPLKKNDITQKHPLFFYYETENINYNVSLIIKYIDKIEKIESNVKDKNIKDITLKYIKELSFSLKENIRQKIDEPYASIANGVTLGDNNYLNNEVKQIFINSGLIHLMVLSGTNISLIFYLCWFLIKSFNLRIRVFLSLFFIWFFVLFTGLCAPAIRAGIMATILILAKLSKRKIDNLYLLLLSLFIISVYDINSFFYNPSLHLSFLATFAVFILSPLIYEFINLKLNKKNFHFIKLFFSVITSITLTTTPYLLALVGKFGTGGLFLTFIAEPITFIIMVMTLIFILFSWLPIFSNLLILVITFFSKLFYQIAIIGANNFPTINLRIEKMHLIIYYVILFLMFLYLRKLIFKIKNN